MRRFLAKLQGDLCSRVPLVLWLVASFCLAITGPFGTYGVLSFAERVLFWTPLIAFGFLAGSAMRVVVHSSIGVGSFWWGAVLTTALVCLVLCPPFYLMVHAMFSGPGGAVPGLWEIVLLVASLSLGVCSLRFAMQPEAKPAVVVAAEVEAVPSRLVMRLEPDLRGTLRAISVRDHYVDVLTNKGRGSLLMRFADAMEEAKPVEGVQVHRSHWVAWDEIEAVETAGSRSVLRLREGITVPVSRNHREKLAARGLI